MTEIPKILLSLTIWISIASSVAASAPLGDKYSGIEYFGSSQVSRLEIEKILGLKPGASVAAVEKALERLSSQLEARHIPNNIEVVAGAPGTVYIAIDVLDSSVDSMPTRKLRSPRHVLVRSEKPFMILQQLNDRLEKLSSEGRTWTETYTDGLKYYSDEPANQCVAEIIRFAPDMQDELLAVVESDPDPSRRSKAIDLLGWSGNVPQTAYRLIDAMDDSDPKVRANAIRYIFPRLSMLPEEFAYDRLIAAASRELYRPSHQDRSKGLAMLLALARINVLFVRQIKELDETRVKQLADESILPTVKNPAQQLKTVIETWDKGPIGVKAPERPKTEGDAAF